MRAFILNVVAALVLCGCQRADPPAPASRTEAYPIAKSPIEGYWFLHSVNDAPATSPLLLSIERTRFQVDGCGTIRGRVPPANGERVLLAGTRSPACPEIAWKEHRTIERLLRSQPTATLAGREVDGCPGPALELRGRGRRWRSSALQCRQKARLGS
jgi:hypothetical protein